MSELADVAPAKVNLVLEVLGRREDGYHEIDTVLQTVALADRVSIRFEGPPGVRVTGPRAAGTPAGTENLAWKAAAALAARLGREIDALQVRIEKHIPAAGGLGGGSSDAAATLRLLKRAWTGATDEDLLAAATSVGSDEAFFLAGGTARARGRGERVEPLPPLPRHGVVLFIPPATLERKTARLFAALGRTPFDDGERATAFCRSLPRLVSTADLCNAFERVAFEEFPGLAALRGAAEARVGEPLRLAGAGPALFWIGAEGREAEVAARCAGLGCEVIATTTVAPTR